ncbi:unnamed protein product [Laminaria digitata]
MVRAAVQRTSQWPSAKSQQLGGGAVPTSVRRVAKRARSQAPAGGATEALLKELLSTPVTKSSTRWTDEDIHGRPREKSTAPAAAAAAATAGVLSAAGTPTTIVRPPPPLSPVLRDEGATAAVSAAATGGAAAAGPSAGGAAAAAASMVNSAAAAAATSVSAETGSTTVVSDPRAGSRPAVLALGVGSGSVEAAAVELPPPLVSFDMNGDDNSHPIQVHSGGADFYRLSGR